MKPPRRPGQNSGWHQSTLWMAVVCIQVLLTGRAPALDPAKNLTEFNCQTWSRLNGLMANGVNTIAQTEDGYLWLGTASGLIRFDGIGFTSLYPPESDNRIITGLSGARNGGLWVGGENNVISYYDGQRWRTNAAVPTRETGSNRSLQMGRDGTVWVTSEKQLGRLTPDGAYQTLMAITFQQSTNILSGFHDSQGRFWYGTAGYGVGCWQAGSVHPLTAPELTDELIFALTEDPAGNLWVGTAHGLFCYDTHLQRKDITPLYGEIKALLVDRQGVLWIATSTQGLARYQNGKYDFFTKINGLASDAVISLAEDREGSLWVGTRNGVSQLTDVKFPTGAASASPGALDAVSVSVASQGGVWVGNSVGLAHWDHQPKDVGAEAGLTNTFVKRILETRNGDLYLICGDKYLAVISRGTLTAEYTATNMVAGLAEDEKGVVVAMGGYFFRVGTNGFTPYAFTNGLTPPVYWLNDLEPGRNGVLWAGSVNGITRIKDDTFQQWTVEDGLSDYRVGSVCEDNEGTVWGAMKTGIARLKPGPTPGQTSLAFAQEDFTNLPLLALKLKKPADPVSAYLVTNLPGATLKIMTNYHGPGSNPVPLQTALAQNFNDLLGGPLIYEDRRFAGVVLRRETQRLLAQNPQNAMLRRLNRLLLEDAYPLGIARHPSPVVSISEADGLFDNNVYAIVPDDLGNLWVDAARGIFRVSRQSLNDFADGRTERVECKAFDGLESVKPSDKTFQEHVGCKSLDGRIWFPSPNGVVMINPRQIPTNTVPPPVHLEHIRANGRDYSPGRAIVVPPGGGELILNYAALSFIAPQKIQFRYRLEGYDLAWVEADNRRLAYYTNLKPGRYTFRVIAANADGVWNQTGDSQDIELRPHYYETGWFYGGCLALLFTGLAGGYGGFIRGMRHKAQRLQEARDRLEREVNLRTLELSYERDLLRGLLDYAPDQIYFKDAQSRFIRTSKSMAEKIGMKNHGAMVGKTDFDVFAEDHARRAFEDEQQIIRTGRPVAGKVEQEIWKDGRVTWALTSKLPLRDKTGQIIGTLGISKDITALKQTETELAYERDLLRALMENSPDHIYFKDLQSRFIKSCNAQARKFGLSSADVMLGKTDFYYFTEEHARPAYEDEQEIIRTGQPITGKVEKETWPDGRVAWVLTNKMPLRNQDGQIIGTFGISKDITAMKQTELELAYERDLLRSLLDSSPDPIFFKDLQSRFVRVSQSVAKGLRRVALSLYHAAHPGVAEAELPPHLAIQERFNEYLIGKTDTDIYGPERAAAFSADEREIIRTGRPMISKSEQTICPDGQVIWYMTTKVPWRNPAGEIIGTFGTSRDISALKQAEARVEEIHKQLLETSRQAGMAEVATNVLHNVGNVLNSVNVSASVVLDNTKKSQLPYLGKVVALLEEHAGGLGEFLTRDSRGRELPAFLGRLAGQLTREQAQVITELEMLREHIEHIKEVVAMQQSYAKISGVVETIQMADLVEDALRMNIGALDRHRIQLVRDFHDLPPVTVEKHKILQILVNLIRNAKYACDESGRTDKVITLQLAPAEHGVRIAVIDNGVGIPPEIQARLFDHGFTTRKGGHGFGLHSGALTARELGGSLTAFSAGCGQGATFTLLLPLQPTKT